VAPLIAGSLLGMAFQESTPPVPVSNQEWTTDDLVKALESMASGMVKQGNGEPCRITSEAGITLERQSG